MKKFLTAAALMSVATLSQAEPASYAIDPSHTFVTYEIAHFATSTNRGRFDKKEGSVTIDRAAKTGKIDITFDMAAVNTGVAAMDRHLRSDDFFGTDKFPTARFVGDKLGFNGDKLSEVSGLLTLKDKTMPVTLKAIRFNCYQNPLLKREVCGGDFEATILRSQYGISYGLNSGFPDAVQLLIQVEAVRQ